MLSNSSAAIALSESVAEDLAGTFLTTYFGSDIFISSDIERILAEKVNVIYQDIDDAKYSGAFISYKGAHFIALNTHQTPRARYYSAAHELWHLVMGSDLFGAENKQYKELIALPGFDTERAADHFAAAIMMPKDAMIKTWNQFVSNQAEPTVAVAQNAIVRIANVSSMPYEAVTRRLSELGLLLDTRLAKLTDTEWQDFVNHSSFPPSPLDKVEPFKKFSRLTQIVNALVDKKQLSLVEAAQLTTYADPTAATDYLNKRQEIIDRF
ncbi:ImmA/IrrE family metallo-endopeptidase [Lacticaseibacillus paracasei]|uniref:ImmA/IrrE family metallo-endopeptidase n=1 Tax=Lacticaseibacillus paracasei TaxID=1597 RepID=UPI0022EC8C1D|nr:ImmA/IrrE family metallo-endopeptidase [Lacticaseibacillus paracasei]WBS98842.1 ImmA/IrrE family metallo-endopeptidase [Lacticaseibacillus paracasei]